MKIIAIKEQLDRLVLSSFVVSYDVATKLRGSATVELIVGMHVGPKSE